MSDWNPKQYLQFEAQRTQPALDLANRIRGHAPASIVDIGCGPGNSTAVLKTVFPYAKIRGIDSSETMIQRAKETDPEIDFSVCSAESLTGTYDLLFSNACLQWIPDHETLIPQLMTHLTEQGVLAVQIPMNQQEPLYRSIDRIAADPKWNFDRGCLQGNRTLSPRAYFELLSDCAGRFELWETVYYHSMPSRDHLLEWVKGTRLRPYLAALDDSRRIEFENVLREEIQKKYPLTAHGDVIFPFRRFFFLAYRK